MSAHRAGPTQRAAHQSSQQSGLLHTPKNENLRQYKKNAHKEQEGLKKQKAITVVELVAAGGLLTAGSTIMEKLSEDSAPQITASEVTYNQDKGTALIKFETV